MRIKDLQKKEAIHKAALEIVTSEGLQGSSMSKIAKLAGVSPATIYIYFDNKEDMLNKLYLLVKKRSADFIFKNFHEIHDTKEGFYEYIKRQITFMLNNPIYFSFHEQFLNSPKIDKDIRNQAFEYYSPITSLFNNAVQSGVTLNYDIKIIAAFITSPIFNIVGSAIAKEIVLDDTKIEEICGMCWRAITPGRV